MAIRMGCKFALLVLALAPLAAHLADINLEEEEQDPFAEFTRAFVSDATRLRADREAKRLAFKHAEASLKEGKRMVAELEKQLQAAQAALRKNESVFAEAKAAKQAAEKAMLDSLTRMAGQITKTAEEAMGTGAGTSEEVPAASPEDMVAELVMPASGAKVLLWEGRQFTGRSLAVPCCGTVELSPLLQEAGIRTFRSVTVPKGFRAGFQAFAVQGEAPGSSFSLYGDAGELDGMLADHRESCCVFVELTAGVRHNEGTSVVLYEGEGFTGRAEAFLEGDYKAPKVSKVRSVRVPAGLRVTLRAVELADSAAFGAVLAVLKRDTRTFPTVDTSTGGARQDGGPPVRSISVRRALEHDLQGLWVYPLPDYKGRPQFFESGAHYLYPDTWPPIRSLRPTNWTSTRFFANASMVMRHPVPIVDETLSRPHTIEVMAKCDPADFCGSHGKCTHPQRCTCETSYQGDRCHLQIPDATSAITCERNAIVIGESLACRLELRRDGEPCNATSFFLQVDAQEEARKVCELFGGPIIRSGLARYTQQEADHFDFEAVFNQSGIFETPFLLSIFGKPAVGSFVPRIEVLPRCDVDGLQAAVQCTVSAVPDGFRGYRCATTLHAEVGHTTLRCPANCVRAFALDDTGKAEALQTIHEGSPVVERALFLLPHTSAVHAVNGRMRFKVEVKHGVAGAPKEFLVQATLADAVAPTPGHHVAHARTLLASSDIAGALRVLEVCSDQACQRLRVAVLIQLGRYDDALDVARASSAPLAATTRTRVVEAKENSERARDALRQHHFPDASHFASKVLEISPLSVPLRLLYAEAALQSGAFSLALEQVRHAHRLHRLPLPGVEANDAARTLAMMGQALLGLGLADAARQNFRGCAELQALSGEDVACEKLVLAVRNLTDEAAVLRRALRKEEADGVEADMAVERFRELQAAQWPAFGHSLWALEADVVQCHARAGSRVNATVAELEPCARVAGADAELRGRLPIEGVLLCHAALAHAHERGGNLDEALAQADKAEGVLEDAGDDLQEAHLSELRLLRERLARQVRRRQEAAGSSQGRNSSRDKEQKPRDHYEVLGIARNATLAEVKAAYRRMALKYHPDKNPDPAAVPMFLDIQQAYQVLSDENLRNRYDAGIPVDDEVGGKNLKPMRYRVIEVDRERNVARIWWFDPNTNEEGIMEVDLPEDETEERTATVARKLREHCCLPHSKPA